MHVKDTFLNTLTHKNNKQTNKQKKGKRFFSKKKKQKKEKSNILKSCTLHLRDTEHLNTYDYFDASK